MLRRLAGVIALVAGATALGACGGEGPSAPSDLTALAAVTPAGGTIDVSTAGPVTITFSHAMMAGMELYAALHEGDVAGPVVAGTWAWSADHEVLTFTPSSPLEAKTRYTIHIGGGMRDANGRTVDMDPGRHMGGAWATRGMMGGGGMMGGAGSMMGPGWQHANGTYGMVFGFTTG